MIARFETEEALLAHPQIKLIPRDVFDTFYRGDNIYIRMLQSLAVDDSRLIERALPYMCYDISYNISLVFLSIILMHPTKDVSELCHIAEMMRISQRMTLLTVVYAGHLQLYLRLLPVDGNGNCCLEGAVLNDLFREAVIAGHFNLVLAIDEMLPQYSRQDFFCDNFSNFASHNVDFLNQSIVFFLGQPAFQVRMVPIGNFQLSNAFRYAINIGDVALLQRLKDWVPGHLQQMMISDRYATFECAAENGHWHLINSVQMWFPDCMYHIIESNDYYLIKLALADLKYQMVNNFFRINAESFDQASKMPLFGMKRTYTFLRNFLKDIRDDNNGAQVSPQDTALCYYILRFLIKQLDERDLPEIKFLTCIPALRKLLIDFAMESVVHPETHLYMLARELGYVEAARLLRDIPIIENLPKWQGISLWKPVSIKAKSIQDKPVRQRARSNSM